MVHEQADSAKAILKVRDLNFSYESTPILENVNFTLYQGDFAALIGPNGAGKSSLMRLLLGFLKPTQGSLEIAGLPAGSKELAGKIAYVPQSLQDLNFHFPASIREIVAGNLYPLGRAWRRKERQRRRKMVDESLAMVGLEGHAEDHLDMLSGGQVQRVLLARAMISKPKILFLDEPTAGIDHKGAEDFYHILKQLSDEEDMTILLITHDLYRIKDFCQRFLCLGPKGFFEVRRDEYGSQAFFQKLYGQEAQ